MISTSKEPLPHCWTSNHKAAGEAGEGAEAHPALRLQRPFTEFFFISFYHISDKDKTDDYANQVYGSFLGGDVRGEIGGTTDFFQGLVQKGMSPLFVLSDILMWNVVVLLYLSC